MIGSKQLMESSPSFPYSLRPFHSAPIHPRGRSCSNEAQRFLASFLFLLSACAQAEVVPRIQETTDPTMEGDRRLNLNLSDEARQRIVNKITETILRRVPLQDSSEIRRIAARFEERMYATAASQSDYLRRISWKLVAVQTQRRPVVVSPPAPLTPPLSPRRRVYDDDDNDDEGEQENMGGPADVSLSCGQGMTSEF